MTNAGRTTAYMVQAYIRLRYTRYVLHYMRAMMKGVMPYHGEGWVFGDTRFLGEGNGRGLPSRRHGICDDAFKDANLIVAQGGSRSNRRTLNSDVHTVRAGAIDVG